MRTIQVVNVRWYNATAWYGLTLTRLLAAAGHPSLALVLAGTETEEKAREMGLAHLALPLNAANPLVLARLYGRLAQLTAEFRPDVVDCHRGESFVLWGLLARMRGGFKLVRTRGDQRLPRADPLNRWLHGKVADAVVATNAAMAAYFREKMGVPERKLRCIRGGVDRERFRFDAAGRERVRAEFGFGPEDMVVGLLGRFDEVKGHRELIRAVAEVRARPGGQRAKLFLIGFDTALTEGDICAWIGEAGIGEATRISGFREDVAACISALDVGVVASKWSETIARAALEIMACGRPLVGTRVGVMPDLLAGEALVPPGDVSALAGVLGRCLAKPAFLAKLTAKQAKVVANLSHESFLAETLALYQEIRR